MLKIEPEFKNPELYQYVYKDINPWWLINYLDTEEIDYSFNIKGGTFEFEFVEASDEVAVVLLFKSFTKTKDRYVVDQEDLEDLFNRCVAENKGIDTSGKK